MSGRKKIIEFKNVTFKYTRCQEPTLKNVSFDIYEGEKVLIAGSSGSGKSTISYCLNGLIPHMYEGEMSGEILIDGERPCEMKLHELSGKISTILQDQDAQFIGLTVKEDVAFVMENRNIPLKDMNLSVAEALEKVDMEAFQNSNPHEISGGQKQRVSLAGVLASKSGILLFDEPLANLDPASGENAMKLLSEIHKKYNKTVVIIEHRIEEVLSEKFDRVLVVSKGEIIANGTPQEILLSGVLVSAGLREPHYIRLMKLVGCNLNEYHNLDSPSVVKEASAQEKIHNFLARRVIKRESDEEREYALEVQNLTFSYGERLIFHDLNFSIKKGEIVTLLGANGVGKSTLSSVITGFLRHSRGEIKILGEDISNASIKKRGELIGYVMQNPNLMITKNSVFDEVAYGLKNKKVAKQEIVERVHQLLKICGLYGYRNWPISALSFGQKKRVTIASILVLNPMVLILDEPTAGQDYKHYLEFMGFISKISKMGIGILFITHDMHLALEYGDKSIVLYDTSIIAESTPTRVLMNCDIVKKASLREHSLSNISKLLNISSLELTERYLAEEGRQYE